MNEIALDVLDHILMPFLGVYDIVQFGITCRDFHKIAKNKHKAIIERMRAGMAVKSMTSTTEIKGVDLCLNAMEVLMACDWSDPYLDEMHRCKYALFFRLFIAHYSQKTSDWFILREMKSVLRRRLLGCSEEMHVYSLPVNTQVCLRPHRTCGKKGLYTLKDNWSRKAINMNATLCRARTISC